MSLRELITIARGDGKPSLVLKNAQLINVFSHETYRCDIAIQNEYIVGIGIYDGDNVIDLKGSYVCPGFIDGHIHVESSMITIPEFTKAVLPRGTTTIIIDPHEITNVMGLEGINYMLKSSKYNPLNVFIMLPSCVPATRMETAGADLKAIDLLPLLNNPWVLGLGEMMNYPGLLGTNEEVLEKIKVCKDRIIDGHAPALTGKDLNAYVSAGVRSDHECITAAEASEKLRLGMHIMLREGSSSKNLLDLLPAVTCNNLSKFSFVSDDLNPRDLMIDGHIDRIIRMAVASGIDLISAIRMATINTARYFQLKELGAIAPGYKADIVVFDDPADIAVKMVFKNGILVAQDGKAIYEKTDYKIPKLRGSVNIKWLSEEDFRIKARGAVARVIGLIPGQIITQPLLLEPTIVNGYVEPDIERDIIKLAIIERHMASEEVSKGLLHGLGLKRGAIATTVAHDSHNMLVAGTNDHDMFVAAVHLAKTQGGIAIALDGQIIECLPLPIAGLISDQPLETVVEKLSSLLNHARTMGIQLPDPFMAISFLALPVIPALKLTDKGLIDVLKFEQVDLFVS